MKIRMSLLPISSTKKSAGNASFFSCFFGLATFLLLFFLNACAQKQDFTAPGDQHAAGAWGAFVEKSLAAEQTGGPFRVSASLRYSGEKGQGTRLSALLWGNGDPVTPYPLRLDLFAGIGNAVAKIREDQQRFLAYSPEENTAYTRARSTLFSFGVPIPMTLGDLAQLLTGRPGRVFLPAGGTSSPMPNDFGHSEHGTLYALSGTLSGLLELSSDGTPVSWRQKPAGGWHMAFEYDEISSLRPKRVRVTHPDGYSALIVVREVDFLPAPFPSDQLDLVLPTGTVVKPLTSNP